MSSHGLTTNVLTDVVLPLALAFVTLGMGLSLTGEDFRRVLRMPRAVAVGLAAQVLVLPLLALATAWFMLRYGGWSEELALGLLVLAACPGGATSNLVTYLARADVALSVSLTSVTSLASALTTPIAFVLASRALFGESATLEVSFVQMAGLVAVVVVLPILAGLQIRSRRPTWAARAEVPVKRFSIAVLVLVIAGVIVANRADFWSLAARSVPGALVLNVLALLAGLGLGHALRVGRARARAIAIEVGFQNGTLGIALAVTQLGSSEAAIVPGFYSLVMFTTGGLLAWWWSRDAPVQEPDVDVQTTAA